MGDKLMDVVAALSKEGEDLKTGMCIVTNCKFNIHVNCIDIYM